MATIPEGWWIETRPPPQSGPITFDNIAPPLTWGERVRKTIAALGRRLLRRLPRPAAGAAADVAPAAHPAPTPRPAGGGATQLPAADVAALSADVPRICYVRPEEIIDVWSHLEPAVQALRPRLNIGALVRAAAAGRVALWVTAEPDTDGFAGALVVGSVNGTIALIAATDSFATRWPDFTPFAVVCETYRTPCRRVAPGLLSDAALQAHGLHTLTG